MRMKRGDRSIVSLDEIVRNENIDLEDVFESFSSIEIWKFLSRLNVLYVEKYMN